MLLFGIIFVGMVLVTVLVISMIKPKKEEKVTSINDFAIRITSAEAGKQELSIAQVKEILRITDYLLDGEFYDLIRKGKSEKS